MTADKQRLRYLLKAFANNQATAEEVAEMLPLLRQDADDAELNELMQQLRVETAADEAGSQADWEKIWNVIRPVKVVKKLHWWRVAAAIIIMLGLGAYFWFNQDTMPRKAVVKTTPAPVPPKDIQPGGNKAVLTLADGSQIVLDSAANGQLAVQGSTEVLKLADGQLAYKGLGGKDTALLYNTINTPRGGQYRLILPDGSKVWLNALSSIRYPAAFTGNERKVAITGEAYFEVAKDAKHPFRVSTGTMEVAVLGTHFNINAYNDEPSVNTTLLEGSVKINQPAGSVVISPGQQAQLNSSGKIKVASDVDMASVVAWKEGRFIFRDTDLKTIMQQLMRWYDVEVKYDGSLPERYFTADISRNKTLSGVLKILEQSNIHFELQGRTLTVRP